MAYKVVLSALVRDLLTILAVGELGAAKDLRLVLMGLRQNPRPQGSRELKPEIVEPVPGERVWERPNWIITYQIDELEQKVQVGEVRRR